MADRLELHSLLQELLGSSNVYYQPPESIKMQYDAIRYSKQTIMSRYANDRKYMMRDCYELIVISRLPDNPVIKKLLELPYCSYNRHYIADNLHHDVLTIYY
nr:MAG TPA: tail completion protein [Caudoviricetes sp.]